MLRTNSACLFDATCDITKDLLARHQLLLTVSQEVSLASDGRGLRCHFQNVLVREPIDIERREYLVEPTHHVSFDDLCSHVRHKGLPLLLSTRQPGTSYEKLEAHLVHRQEAIQSLLTAVPLHVPVDLTMEVIDRHSDID